MTCKCQDNCNCDCNQEIVYVLEFDDDSAIATANDFLANGWKLISVGPKLISTLENGQAYYNIAYVVGATKDLYDDYLKSLSESDL